MCVTTTAKITPFFNNLIDKVPNFAKSFGLSLNLLLPIGRRKKSAGGQAEMFDNQAEKCEWDTNLL
jgi:hypothetical protein